jgi:uridine kinase
MPQSNQKPFVIGVAGGSGSGKSTVTRQVLASVGPDMASVLYQDDYYLDQSHMSPEERRKTNYDHPQAFDWPLMVRHLQALYNRSDQTTILLNLTPVIVVENLLAV